MLAQAMCDFRPVPLSVHQAFAVLNPSYKPAFLEVHIDPVILEQVFDEDDARQKSVSLAMEADMQEVTSTKKATIDDMVMMGLLSSNPLVEKMKEDRKVISDINNGMSSSRICMASALVKAKAKVHAVYQEWIAPRPLVEMRVYHKLPPELQDAIVSNSAYLEEFEANAPKEAKKRTQLHMDRAIYEWLEMLNEMTEQNAKLEANSGNGLVMADAIGQSLYAGRLNAKVADQIEEFGYRVSLDTVNDVMLLDLKSGTFRWTLS